MVLALVTPTSIDPDQWHVLYVTYYSASVRVLRNPSAASRRDCCTYVRILHVRHRLERGNPCILRQSTEVHFVC